MPCWHQRNWLIWLVLWQNDGVILKFCCWCGAGSRLLLMVFGRPLLCLWMLAVLVLPLLLPSITGHDPHVLQLPSHVGAPVRLSTDARIVLVAQGACSSAACCISLVGAPGRCINVVQSWSKEATLCICELIDMCDLVWSGLVWQLICDSGT